MSLFDGQQEFVVGGSVVSDQHSEQPSALTKSNRSNGFGTPTTKNHGKPKRVKI